MTVKVTIKGMTIEDPSKAEEYEVMSQLRDLFQGRDAYLASLFTNEFVQWVENQIRDDFPPNVMEVMEARYEDLTIAGQALTAERRQTKVLQDKVKSLEVQIAMQFEDIKRGEAFLHRREKEMRERFEEVVTAYENPTKSKEIG